MVLQELPLRQACRYELRLDNRDVTALRCPEAGTRVLGPLLSCAHEEGSEVSAKVSIGSISMGDSDSPLHDEAHSGTILFQ